MFDIVRTARLQPSDLAKLLNVNRITVSMWLNGHSSPHRLLAERVESMLGVIRRAVDAGDLPVPHDITRRERGHYIRTTIEKHSDVA